MASRFPMNVPPFPPLAMADSERDRLEYLAHRLVHKAIDDYDVHRQAGGNVDARSWKLVRKCDHLAMYKRTEPSGLYQVAHARQPATPIRSRAESASVVGNSITQGRPRQKMPVLLQVGSIQGSLNEVMYGTVAVDGPTMMLKTAYTEGKLLDAETLCQLRGPSRAQPFRFLGVKWVVKGTPHAALAPIVRPRDLVFIEATGILTREDSNERVGYHLMHSVSVPGYGPLDDRKIIRAQISCCILYIETPESPGGVDVFMKARFDPNGNVSESVATQSIALTLMYSAKASVCAQNKKLSWLIRSSSDSSARKRPTRSMSMARQRSCPICAKNFNMFSGTAECEICSTVTCHACSVKKKLGFAKTGSKRVILHPVTFCTSCLTHARRLDDFDAARQEVMAGFGVDETSSATSRSRGESIPSVHNCRRRDIQKTKTAPSITKDEPPEVTRHHSEGVMEENNTPPRARQRVNTWIGDVGASQATHRWDELERQVAASGLVEPSEELEEFGEITIHESSLVKVADGRDQRSVSFAEPYPGSPKCETTQEDFMARIITMRKAAEDAYLTTRKTAQAQFEQITEVPSVSATTRTPTRSGNAS
ncbi:hypothetical protein PF005_g6281 [Phytophthora fragariae]|uniref:FYVE-type domain-containing protein n=1 Tax=Phytophthora fragariae TaxID=53985 RepID=A0A6A3FMR3_9STRA|nr:hypothetical protein PF003_g32442 [Phytophthora fragariae]KAE8947039.1 hypothetical protein PF009_g3354 [Phytophthora fragariae]KAE9004117.1 hypothetical protein PF011_g12603 [Phytophthora fragariae]KAE9123385.1 hypothetical protein PF007_g7082 [Phytophthora fragariae]KAE9127981.1 hypothetical protein PF010_g4687 [Phytophthora fragariae]